MPCIGGDSIQLKVQIHIGLKTLAYKIYCYGKNKVSQLNILPELTHCQARLHVKANSDFITVFIIKFHCQAATMSCQTLASFNQTDLQQEFVASKS